jgi:hypothetical protein
LTYATRGAFEKVTRLEESAAPKYYTTEETRAINRFLVAGGVTGGEHVRAGECARASLVGGTWWDAGNNWDESRAAK